MNLQDAITFVREHATLHDVKIIRDAFSSRLRQLQFQGAQAFRPNQQVLFVDNGTELPATVIKVSRRFVLICLGDQRHLRCDASFLRKISSSSTSLHGSPLASSFVS